MRSLSDALKAAIIRRSRPHIWFLVEFATVYSSGTTPLRLTNYHRQFVWGTKTWQPLGGIQLTKLGEDLRLTVPGAELVLPSLDASMQARFLADQFRGTKVTITLISQEPATSIAAANQLWQTRYTCGADAFDADGVTISLESADAVEGTEVPRRQVSEVGCQWDYMRGNCPYRAHRVWAWANPPTNTVVVVGSLSTVVFDSCSKLLEDADGKPGCRSHFPLLLNPNWSSGGTQPRLLRRPLPYSAFPGGTPNRIVV